MGEVAALQQVPRLSQRLTNSWLCRYGTGGVRLRADGLTHAEETVEGGPRQLPLPCQQADLAGALDCLGSRHRPQLAVDDADVAPHGVGRDEQVRGDLLA